MKKNLHSLILVLSILFTGYSNAQELNARVIINTDLMPSNIEKRIFAKLENDLTRFLNDTRWGKDVFDYFEKIDCNFILNLEQIIDVNTFSASLIVQGSRPIYNATSFTNLMNIVDREFVFTYTENQSIEFNELRIQTGQPLVDNLTAMFAFYAYMIIGLDYNSFALKSGLPYFQKALNIANNSPEHKYINGWNAFNSRRNRYWLIEAVTNNSNNLIHNAYYSYYRDGMDNLWDKPKEAKKNIIKALSQLHSIATESGQNLAILSLFMQGKTDELIRIFKQADDITKKNFKEIIEKVDANNLIRYEREVN